MKNTMKKPVAIPVEKLHPFTGHPFKVKDDEEMNTLIESIQTQGILSPMIVRPIEDIAADFNIDVLLLSHSLTTFAFSVPNGGVIIHGTPSLILLTTMR